MRKRKVAHEIRVQIRDPDNHSFYIKAVERTPSGDTAVSPRMHEILLHALSAVGHQAGSSQRQNGALTPREVQIVQALAEGKSNKQVAADLGISARTVGTHRAKVMSKLGLHSISELVRYAFRNGVASP